MVNLKSIKTQLISFLLCFALYLAITEKGTNFLLSTSIATFFAIITESIILYFKEKKLIITESSVITGLIIGYVLATDNRWWIFVLACLFAIGSKYLIRFHKIHLFNPAALGIVLSILLFQATTQWKGTYAWYILVPFGIYFISKIRKIEVLLGYGITTLILFGIQAVIQKASILNIFSYLSYFYIFIMFIEPKTTPIMPIGKVIFGSGVAVLIFILTEIGVKFDVELFSLLIFNLTVPILNKLASTKGVKA
jgi:Na+-translocating ferredoxin:NAD+ oxidoreductase RnfD subunit